MSRIKFSLTSETESWFGCTLFRIQAECDFGNVKKGEKGGFVERAENLDHDGDAWVSGNARVSGDARVSGGAQVYGDAWVSGNARVSGDALVYGDAWVSGNARVSGDARVSGGAQVSPINIIGLGYTVTIIDSQMQIGCERHSFADWRDFDDRRIAQMDGAASARFWRKNRETLLAIITAEREVAQ